MRNLDQRSLYVVPQNSGKVFSLMEGRCIGWSLGAPPDSKSVFPVTVLLGGELTRD